MTLVAGEQVWTPAVVVQVGLTLTGVNTQVVFTGNPEQERLTTALNPFTGVTVTTLLTKPPTVVERAWARPKQ